MTQNNFSILQYVTEILFDAASFDLHILLNVARDLKFLSDSTCTNLWFDSAITPYMSYIRYTDCAYCIDLSWIKCMYILKCIC